MASVLKKERLELRCTADQREIISKAASLSGRSVTDFILAAVQSAAVETIKNFETMKVSVKDSTALANALLNPPAPGARLRKAAERYKAANS